MTAIWSSAVIAAVVSAAAMLVSKILDRKWSKKDKDDEKNAEIREMIGKIEKKLDAHIRDDDERYIVQRRESILSFADELINEPGKMHTQGRFEQVMRDITAYENYCDSHKDFENSITVQANAIIKETYQACCREHSFI